MLDTIVIDMTNCNDGAFSLTVKSPIVAIIRDGLKLTIGTLRPTGLLPQYIKNKEDI